MQTIFCGQYNNKTFHRNRKFNFQHIWNLHSPKQQQQQQKTIGKKIILVIVIVYVIKFFFIVFRFCFVVIVSRIVFVSFLLSEVPSFNFLNFTNVQIARIQRLARHRYRKRECLTRHGIHVHIHAQKSTGHCHMHTHTVIKFARQHFHGVFRSFVIADFTPFCFFYSLHAENEINKFLKMRNFSQRNFDFFSVFVK